MKISCNVIEDLLPLYVDEAASEDSRQLVEEHLKGCPSCRKMLEEMKLVILKKQLINIIIIHYKICKI